MLSIPNHHHIQSYQPHSPKLQLSTVTDDDDELLSGLAGRQQDDIIVLEDTPDVVSLDQFWSGVEEDLHNDPTWFTFTED